MQRTTRSIGFYAAILLMIATTGTGAVAGTQSGHSPVYQFDLTYNGDVAGKVTVNTAAIAQLPKYVLVAHGLTPNTKYTFGYTVSGEVWTIGSTDTPKAGALVLNGTFPLDDAEDLQSAQFWVMETPPGDSYTEISGFRLTNMGGFVAQLACYYSTDGGVTWTETGHTSDIALIGDKLVNLDDYGVPTGALAKIHAIVIWGKDRTGSQVFQTKYYPSGPMNLHPYADYIIRGTTLNSKLEYDGLEDLVW
jgi:hypothetical protein